VMGRFGRGVACLVCAAVAVAGPCSDGWAFRDVYSDTWAATDALGRELPGYEECGPVREGRYVGVFYFLWLGGHGTGGPYDITKLLAERPENPTYGPQGAFHHWGEPEAGYYLSDSEYVIRRHARMLAEAGVDTLIFDVTNGFTYTATYMKLCGIYREMRQAGDYTPQVCFLTHSNSAGVIKKLYDELYSKGLYEELWFRWKGKPLILGGAEGLDVKIREFFSVRDCWAWTHGKDTWSWLDHWPQQYAWHEAQDRAEEVSVSVAEHPTTNIGRSHSGVREPVHDKYGLTATTGDGIYFGKQWDKALDIDPEFVFITGWNEWVAQRFIAKNGQGFLGEKLGEGQTFFVDQYNQEYSRDIEPMKGGHGDNYYYQMVAGIRRYKGVRQRVASGEARTIRIDGDFSDWQGVKTEYRDWVGDTEHRKEKGWGSAGEYVDATGRNDFAVMKVAHDWRNVYFYVQTKEAITRWDDPHWMMLFIDSDGEKATGWEGYDYLINGEVADDETSTLKRSVSGWDWNEKGRVKYKVKGNEMEIAVRRAAIGQERKVGFDFHWADNIQKDGDIVEFAASGDSAPSRRFNYRYGE